jgi:hypothetical protein
MWCIKCNRHLGQCVCPDRAERTAKLNEIDGFVYKRCRLCQQHYALCHCVNPEWELAGKDATPEMEAALRKRGQI